MIKVTNLSKRYGPRTAIEDVSFDVRAGEILGFLGPNGAGKSTTMRIITGFLPADSGTVEVDGYDVFEQSLETRRRIGYMPENVPLYPELSVRDYLAFMAEIKGVPRDDRKAAIDRAIEASRVNEVAGVLIGKLSKGYRQRVGLAQALVADPPVLVLDEPTVGLDPRQIIETRQLIRSLGGDHTIILSTHILPEAQMTCERVMIIREGRIVAEDTPAALAARLRGNAQIEVVVRGPEYDVRDELEQIVGVGRVNTRSEGDVVYCSIVTTPDADVRDAVAACVVTHGWSLLEIRRAAASLEDIFLELTEGEEEEEAE